MPTGYTAGVADGTVTDFKQYAIQCARNFGALILMRDEPLDAEIPEKFEPSNFELNNLVKAEKELGEMLSLSDSQLKLKMEAEFDAEMKSYQRFVAERREKRKRYEAMLDKAKRYRPPTPDHEGYAKFLVTQLEESINWDCGEKYLNPPKQQTLEEWKTQRLESLRRAISRSRERHKEEAERTNQRNEWVAKLRESIAELDG